MILLKSGFADVFNWDYEQGEGNPRNFFEVSCFSVYDTQEKLLEKISDIAGFSVTASDVSVTASDTIANLTVSGLYTVNCLGDYIYCDSPKATDELFELVYTFSVSCFDVVLVNSLTDSLKTQGAEVFE